MLKPSPLKTGGEAGEKPDDAMVLILNYNSFCMQCPRQSWLLHADHFFNTFHLDKLSDDDCLSIFTQHALKVRNFDGHPQFKEIGEKIVRRCNGLPLAAKSIGSLLRIVNCHREWERIYESELWNLPEEQCGIIPALRLSYHHLLSYLKRCFAYCSILPKDYEFEEEEIILLWRAEVLLQQKAMPQIKDLGNQYF
ncbi:putative disease resistance protein RGA3 [Gossypium hirsutum]|uniref:Disease resistance protein RGA3 n=1 Tax=Gossypium hirsutum TaxID=3635 RepID=A0ABM2Z609_GOSHI|nr:putative disease resistance protein RGA3 [Gossypium hirsutum]